MSDTHQITPIQTPTPSTAIPPPHVLLVEDQDRIARGLQELLGFEGFRVSRANDGPSALDVAASERVDAVVLDVMLPGMSGFEVCRALRGRDATRDVPILMLTGLSDTPSKLQGFETGADDYLVKPVVARELSARIRKHLATQWRNTREVHDQRLQAIGQIATSVGHEINNPLSAALGTLEIILLRAVLSPEVRRDLLQCQEHLWRIATTLSHLSNVRDRTVPYVGADTMIDLTSSATLP
jgi:DNA-binding response OmpR family regulator